MNMEATETKIDITRGPNTIDEINELLAGVTRRFVIYDTLYETVGLCVFAGDDRHAIFDREYSPEEFGLFRTHVQEMATDANLASGFEGNRAEPHKDYNEYLVENYFSGTFCAADNNGLHYTSSDMIQLAFMIRDDD